MIKELSQSQFALLKELSNKPNSASSLAKKLDVSLPYILNQLKLLEAKSFIKKEAIKKTGLAGKPKQKYSIKISQIELNIISNQITTSKSIQNKTMKIFLQLCAQIDENKQNEFAKIFWNYAKEFKKITSFIKVNETSSSLELIAITNKENKKAIKKIFFKENNQKKSKINFLFKALTKEEFEKEKEEKEK